MSPSPIEAIGGAFTRAGRVTALFRYPVKSMRGHALERATVDRHGLTGDRRFALRRIGVTTGFPWLTATRAPALILYEVALDLENARQTADVTVRAPEGKSFVLGSDSFADHIRYNLGHEIEAMHLDRGIFDCAGVSVISRQTIESLEQLAGRSLDVARFRPNIVVDTSDASGFPEHGWLGARMAIGLPAGGVELGVTEDDPRCSMINLDPETGESDPVVLRTVAQQRANIAGVYAVPIRLGAIAVGDPVYVALP